MRKLLTLFAVLGLVACGVARGQNALMNPGFETPLVGGMDDWNPFMSASGIAQQDATMPLSGTKSAELLIDGANQFAGVFQPMSDARVPISPGQEVVFMGFNKSVLQPFAVTRELKIEWHGAPQLRVDSFGPIGAAYEPFMLAGIAPPGTTGATITYAISSFNPNQTQGHVFLDDFKVTVSPEPASLSLVGLAIAGMVGIRRRRK